MSPNFFSFLLCAYIITVPIFSEDRWRQNLEGLAWGHRVTHEHKGVGGMWVRDSSPLTSLPDPTPSSPFPPMKFPAWKSGSKAFLLPSPIHCESLMYLVYLRHHLAHYLLWFSLVAKNFPPLSFLLKSFVSLFKYSSPLNPLFSGL